jgi:hypothetical protein
VLVERYSIIGIIFSAIIVLASLYLLRKRKISGGTFTLWFIIGLTLGTVSVVPAVWTLLYEVFGTDFLLSAVTAVAFMVLLLLIFYLDYQLNDLKDKMLKLAAKVSSADYGLEQTVETTSKDNEKDEQEQI